jgi:hypothetical protein
MTFLRSVNIKSEFFPAFTCFSTLTTHCGRATLPAALTEASNNSQHRDCYEDQDGFPRHFMIRPLETTMGADIFALVKRGKEPRFPFQRASVPPLREERPHLQGGTRLLLARDWQ